MQLPSQRESLIGCEGFWQGTASKVAPEQLL